MMLYNLILINNHILLPSTNLKKVSVMLLVLSTIDIIIFLRTVQQLNVSCARPSVIHTTQLSNRFRINRLETQHRFLLAEDRLLYSLVGDPALVTTRQSCPVGALCPAGFLRNVLTRDASVLRLLLNQISSKFLFVEEGAMTSSSNTSARTD